MNTELISVIGQSITTAVTLLLFFLFFNRVYGAKYKNKVYYIMGYVVSLMLMISVNQLENIYVNFIYSFISINVICLALFKVNIKSMWLHNFLFWFILSMCDIMTVLIWSIIEGNTLKEILSSYQLMLGSHLLYITFTVLVYKIYTLMMQKIIFQSIKLKTAAYITIMGFFEIWILHNYAMQISDRAGGVKIIVMLLGFLVMNLFLVYILNQISEAYKYKYELSLAKRLCEIQLSDYKEISQKYDESRVIIHDIKKHLTVAKDIKNKDNSAYLEYLSKIYNRMNVLFGRFRCSNKILSIILNQKISYAKENGISIDIQVDEVPINFIDDFDITAIFANLWDNAIEACCKNDGKKFIKMDIGRFNDFLIINMENSYNGLVRKHKKKYLSTKTNHDGVGLKSIQSSVEKYDGIFITKHNDVVFTSEITIPMP